MPKGHHDLLPKRGERRKEVLACPTEHYEKSNWRAKLNAYVCYSKTEDSVLDLLVLKCKVALTFYISRPKKKGITIPITSNFKLKRVSVTHL